MTDSLPVLEGIHNFRAVAPYPLRGGGRFRRSMVYRCGAPERMTAADRAFLAETLHLTETESPAFWKLYRTYREEMDKLGDGLVKLVLEYADYYPDVPEDRAAALLKQYTALEQKYAKRRGWYFKRAGTLLPKSKRLDEHLS